MREELLFVASARFEAARTLRALPEGHRARHLHGHGFVASIRTSQHAVQAGYQGGEVAALRGRLEQVLAPLDYTSLNERLPEPSDDELAHWIGDRLGFAEVSRIELQSTPRSGVELDPGERVRVWRRYALQSAHRLPHVPIGHKCSRMHGHGFEVVLCACHNAHESRTALAYDRLDTAWAPLHAALDHACLNDIPGLENPTSEVLASWIWNRLQRAMPQLSMVVVHETASCGARFDGRRYRIWKDFTLDSARLLDKAPEGDLSRRLHGHTYTLRLHLEAPLDERMGWAMDFGEVTERFAPMFVELDHRPLHEVIGPSPDVATLLGWIRAQTRTALPQLERIDLFETPGCGAILAWGEEGRAAANA